MSELVADSIDVIVYLNRGGLREDSRTATEQRKRWEFESCYQALQSRNIGNVIFRFEPGNPRSMIRANRDPRMAVICIQSSGFELSPEWFQKELQSALRAKPPGGLFKPGEEDGRVLFEATKEFLRTFGNQLSQLDLSTAEQKRRFGPRINGLPQKSLLDLHCDEGLSSADYQALLRLWWLTLDCLRRGIEGALHHQRLPEDPEAPAIRASVLKLRSHLAASLLEFQPTANSKHQVDDDPDFFADLHESVLDWIEFNLETRIRDDDIDFLESRHRELGDLLFEVRPAPEVLQRFSQLSGFRRNGTNQAANDWRSSRRIAIREAVLSAKALKGERRGRGAALSPRELQRDRKVREIIDRYAESLHRTGELFSKRFDVRELVAISNAWPEIRKSPARRQSLRQEAAEFLKGTWRHLPWPYPAFLLLGLFGWIAFAWNTAGQSLMPFSGQIFLTLFSAQFSIVYAVLTYFIFSGLARKERLFAQVLPKLLGSLFVGYAALWLPQETWTFPFYMSWVSILIFVLILLVVSFLYFAVEILGKVKLRSEALQKALAVFLIAAAQAYCIGLVVMDFSARFVTQAVPPTLIGDPEGKSLLSHLTATGQITFVDSPISLLGRAIGSQGMAGHRFWLLPKLLVFWFGLAMFVAVFLHMLWEKEGILERV